jgi:hypothetical protein
VEGVGVLKHEEINLRRLIPLSHQVERGKSPGERGEERV